MRNPRAFLRPLAVGAPTPVADIPFRPSRMIHFFDPSNPKMAAKVPEIAAKVDIILGNLEDAIKTENKEAARQGLVDIAKSTDFGPSVLLRSTLQACAGALLGSWAIRATSLSTSPALEVDV